MNRAILTLKRRPGVVVDLGQQTLKRCPGRAQDVTGIGPGWPGTYRRDPELGLQLVCTTAQRHPNRQGGHQHLPLVPVARVPRRTHHGADDAFRCRACGLPVVAARGGCVCDCCDVEG